MKDDRSLVFVGDLHGQFNKFMSMVKRFNAECVDFVQVGDFGIGFKPLKKDLSSMQHLNEFLEKRDCTISIIRGNHDNPKLFKEDSFKLSHINFIADYSIIELCEKKILMVGGAISVDRVNRVEGINYWKEESFVYTKKTIDNLDLSEVDVICAHTSPKFTFPESFNQFVYDWADKDAGLLRDLENERALVTEFYEYVKSNAPNIKDYFYGHFHDSWNKQIDGVNFRLLNINEFYELR